MKLSEFTDRILAVDPEATGDWSMKKSDYTMWTRLGSAFLYADGRPVEETMRIQVDRYTRNPEDPIAEALLRDALVHDEIAFYYITDFVLETRYYRHIFQCEVAV